METSARALIDHWSWAADKGLMNRNTAGGLRSACTRVLEVLGEGWEQTDISNANVEDLLLRFQNLKKKDYRPEVLEVYKQRFRKAVTSYLEYLANPGSWKPGAREKSAASPRAERPARRQSATSAVANVNQGRAGFAVARQQALSPSLKQFILKLCMSSIALTAIITEVSCSS
jgi:hypothetical protein